MNCTHHPGTTAVGICTRCDRALCEACTQDHRGRSFCSDCAAFLAQKEEQRRQTGTIPGMAQTPSPEVPQDSGHVAAAGQDTSSVDQGHDSISSGPADVYQGQEGVYQGPGDVYQGPGDVYQGPGDSAQGPVNSSEFSVNGDESEAAPLMLRAALVGGLAGAVATGIWFGVSVAMGKQYGFVAMLVGFLVGIGTSLGAGRRGDPQVAFLSLGIFVVSMVAGDYLIESHFYELEMASYAAYDAIEIDGDFTTEEISTLLGIEPSEWEEMNENQKSFWIALVMEDEEDYDSDDGAEESYVEAAYEDGGTVPGDESRLEEEFPDTLSFGAYLSSLPSFLGLWGAFFLFAGGVEAFRFPASG